MDMLIHQYNNASGEYTQFFFKWSKIIFIISKGLMLMYIGSVFVFILFPLVFYFLYGEKVVAIELVFPFMDPTSDKSFYISTLYQIYGMVFACAAMSGLDGIFVLFTFQGLALIEATQASFHEFGCILNAGKSTKLEVKSMLRQVLQRFRLAQE